MKYEAWAGSTAREATPWDVTNSPATQFARSTSQYVDDRDDAFAHRLLEMVFDAEDMLPFTRENIEA